MHGKNDFIEEKPSRPRAARPGDRPGVRTGADPAPAGSGLWDIGDVSAYLRIPVNAVYKMTARRAAVRIPCIRIGGRLRFRQTDVDQWLTALTSSNLDALAKVRQKTHQVTHGHDY